MKSLFSRFTRSATTSPVAEVLEKKPNVLRKTPPPDKRAQPLLDTRFDMLAPRGQRVTSKKKKERVSTDLSTNRSSSCGQIGVETPPALSPTSSTLSGKTLADDVQPAPATGLTFLQRTAQIFNTKKRYGDPAVRFPAWVPTLAAQPVHGTAGSVDGASCASSAEAVRRHPVLAQAVPLDICRKWVAGREAHKADRVNTVALAKMHALEYERRHIDDAADHPECIAPDQRLLPVGSKKEDYEREQIRAFLVAVGEKDPDDILARAKMGGLGLLHRQWVNGFATVSGVLNGLGLLIPDPAAKGGIAIARGALQAATAAATVAASDRRFVNANAEDMMWHGKLDATPGAKKGMSITRAAVHVIRDLRYSQEDAAEMEESTRQLSDALKELQDLDHGVSRDKLAAAERKAEVAFARFCAMAETKGDYKEAVESGKIEFRGNEVQFYTGLTGSALVTSTALLSILTPAVLAAPVTAGASLGAVGVSALLYLGYQLSQGPGADSEAKVQRAIVAWAKSLDTFPGAKVSFRKERAAAYRTYEKAQASWWNLSASSKKAKEDAAMATLLAELHRISEAEFQKIGNNDFEDQPEGRKNWQAYKKLEVDARQATRKPEPDQGAIGAMAQSFMQAVVRGGAMTAPRLAQTQQMLNTELAAAQKALAGLRPANRLRRRGEPSKDEDNAKRAPLQATVDRLQRDVAALAEAGTLLLGAPTDEQVQQAASRLVGIGHLPALGQLLSFDAGIPHQEDRAAAYLAYAQAHASLGPLPAEANAQEKGKLVERLAAIAERPTTTASAAAVAHAHWNDYLALEDAAADALSAPGDAEARLEALSQSFVEAHESKFAQDVAARGWKGPMRLRMDASERLLSGKVAQSQKRLMADLAKTPATRLSKNPDGTRAAPTRRQDEEKRKRLRAQLKRDLLDTANFNLAKHHMREDEPGEAAMNKAALAFGAIANPDVQALFTGDAAEQIDASARAKELTAGEKQKYTDTMVGAQVVGIITNTAVIAADVGINEQKAADRQAAQNDPNHQGALQDYRFNDHKLIGVNQQAPVFQQHAVSAKRVTNGDGILADMRKTVSKPDEEPDHFVDMGLPPRDVYYMDDPEVDTALEATVDEMVALTYVPDFLRLQPRPPKADNSDSEAEAGKAQEPKLRPLDINLTETAASTRVRFKNATVGPKARYLGLSNLSLLKEAGNSVVTVPIQVVAKGLLKATQASIKRSEGNVAANQKARIEAKREVKGLPGTVPPGNLKAQREAIDRGKAQLSELEARHLAGIPAGAEAEAFNIGMKQFSAHIDLEALGKPLPAAPVYKAHKLSKAKPERDSAPVRASKVAGPYTVPGREMPPPKIEKTSKVRGDDLLPPEDPLRPTTQGTVPRAAVRQGHAMLNAAFPANALGVRTHNPALANVTGSAELAKPRKAAAQRNVFGGVAGIVAEQARLVSQARLTLQAINLTTGPASTTGANCLIDSILQQVGIPADQRRLEAASIRVELREAERRAGRRLGAREPLMDSGPQFRNLIDIVNRRHPLADVAVHVVLPAAGGELVMLDEDASGTHPVPRANNVAIMWVGNHYEPIIPRP